MTPAGLLACGSPPASAFPPVPGSGVWKRLAAHSCGGSRGFGEISLTAFPCAGGGSGAPTSYFWIGAGAGACNGYLRPVIVSWTRRSIFVALLLAGPAEAEAPRRVVSANLCADQLLLALADRDQIAALSPLAVDPTLSPAVEAARAFPIHRGGAEDLLRAKADLILIGAHDAPFTRAMLAEQGAPVHALPPWKSLAEGRAQIRDLAARLGRAERGESLIDAIDAALERARGAAGRPATFLTFHRRGWSPGAGTVTSEVAVAAGLVDASASVGAERGGFVSLERVIAAAPDLLIVSQAAPGAEDQGQALLSHPALARLYPPSRRLVAPDQLTLCAGPATPQAIDALAAEIRAKTR